MPSPTETRRLVREAAEATSFGVNNLDLGESGTAGSVDIFPSTAAKGKIALVAADSSGDTTTTITNASQAGARTYTIPDAGASASFVMTKGTQTLAGPTTFSNATVTMSAIPTDDPQSAGVLWSNNGVVTVSAG